MTFTPRKALATTAVSAFLAVGALAGPAAAAPADPAACTAATAQLATAQDGFTAARLAVKAANRPLGKLIAAERKEARTEVRTSLAALRSVQKATAKTRDKSARKALLAQAKAERADVRHSTRLLDSKKALLAEIKADRQAAHAAFAVAKTALLDAQTAAAAACADAPEPVEPTETEPTETEPTETEPTGTEPTGTEPTPVV